MRRIKIKNKKEEKKLSSSFFDTKGKIIGICIAAAVIVIVAIAVMLVESGYGKLNIQNKTDLKLKYVKTSFVNSEGTVYDGVQTESIGSDKTLSTDLETVNLLYSESNLEVRFKFENHDDMMTDVGYFNAKFSGDIKITFERTDDPNKIRLKIKANNGVFRTREVDCNEEFTIDLTEGKILE
jgi:hypothetical protein